jgi:hypothetical protein
MVEVAYGRLSLRSPGDWSSPQVLGPRDPLIRPSIGEERKTYFSVRLSVFEGPYRFDVTRRPNEHAGFGGPGAHHCLGANLARREITVMFRELLRRLPDLEITAEPERLRSNFIHGIKRMPCSFRPGGAR